MRIIPFSAWLLTLASLTTRAAWAGLPGTPELDSSTLTGIVTGVAGVYAVYRLYAATKKK